MILHNPIVSGSLSLAAGSTFVSNNGTISGSEQVIAALPSGVVSGSSQISLGGFDTDDVTEGTSNLYYTDTRVKTKLNADGVISGSSQLTTEFDSRYLNTNGDGVVSGSEQISLSGFSTSNLSEGTNQYYTNTRVLNYVNDLGVISGSTFSSPSQGTVRATINGSNTDVNTGLQIGDSPQFTNLTLTGNLTVAGSTTTTTSNEVNIGDNIINLNYGGSSTTGGIYVKDGTGVSQTSGSFIWDSADGRDYWKAGKLGSETEIVTTANIVSKLPAGTVSGSSQITITESQISDLEHYGNSDVQSYIRSIDVISGSSQVVLNDADKTGFDTDDVTEGTNLYYTDARVKTKLNVEGVISSSAQIGVNNSTITLTAGAGLDGGGSITLNQSGDETITFTVADGVISSSAQLISEFDTRYLNTNGDDVISGSEQVNANDITNFDSNVRDYIRSIDVISGSQQVNINHLDTDNLSEGSSNLYYTNTRVQSFIRSEDVISGSQQILDLVSIDEDDFSTNSATKLPTQQSVKAYITSQIETKDNTDEITEGSSNLYYTDTRVKTKLNAETVISGSSQVNADSITNFDSNVKDKLNTDGVISGSSQVSLSGFSTTNLSEGTNLYYTDARVKTKLNTEGVISGSSQITITQSQISDLEHYTDSDWDTRLATKSTTNLSEGTNLYYTDARVKTKLNAEGVISGSSQITITESQISDLEHYNDTDFDNRLATKTTDNLSEGTNLYYTDARVKTKLNAEGVFSSSAQITITESQISDLDHYNDTDFDNRLATKSTTNLSEGTNLYYTDARVKTKLNTEDIVSGSASQVRAFLNVENGADVTDTDNVTAAGALMDSEVDVDIKTLSLPANTTISAFGKTLVDDVDASAARTTLGVDEAGTDNSTDVTLAGTRNYITISGQTITRNVIDISDDTNLDVSDTTGQTGINLTLSGDTISGVVSGLGTSSDVTFNDVTVSGNLTVNGTTTTVNSNTVNIGDNVLVLNSDETGTPSQNGGIEIERGTSTNSALLWDESNDYWVAGLAGSEVQIALVNGTYSGLRAQATTAGDVGLGNVTNESKATMFSSPTFTGTVSGVTKSHVGLGNVENTALSTYTGQGGALDNQYITNGAGYITSFTNTNQLTTFVVEDGDGTEVTISQGKEWKFVEGNGIDINWTDTSNGTDGDPYDLTITNTAPMTGDEFDNDGTYASLRAQGTTAGDVGLGNVTNESKSTMFTSPTFTGTVSGVTKSHVGLGNVENTAVSTWAGSSNITTLGTISTGTWQGTAIADAYLSSNTAHLSETQTFSGAKTFSEAVNITNSTASTSKTTGALKVTGGVGISGALNVGGDVVAYASSDERLKDNIELISNPIEKVQSLKGVTWNWNDNADELQQSLPNVGVIAQDVEKVLPELVTDRDNGYKGVDYAKLTGLLIEAIKEQQKQIDDLKSQIG